MSKPTFTLIDVKPSDVRVAQNYVRGGINTDWGNELATIAKQSEEWPFEPIDIFKVDDDKKGRKYEVWNGNHRLYAATKQKMTKIPAKLWVFATPMEAFSAQLEATMKSGSLKLDLDARDAAIRQLGLTFKPPMERKRLMEMTGLSEASISRILADKQKAAGSTRGKRRKKGTRKAKRSGQGGNNAFAPLDWYAAASAIVESYREHGAAIVRAKAEVDPALMQDLYNVAADIIAGEVSGNVKPAQQTAEPVAS